ncbi:hypothetical protein Nepgr_021512 [Nepenthes gracilis]|uniref:Autophagy-related protein 13 N-terminal domain-containing protein n=1 Tax=Nepenthes gracilis TaxID=150966 RepID=A0AAD3T128_NEPGR|nr:hypothetical protein Nepgr_021512 [Nepenthes gracilis]
MNSASELGRLEQIVSQFLLKTLHIILESRIPSLKPQDHSEELPSNSRVKRSNKWFNLALGDRPAALENLHFWHRNLMDPMVIDIIVVHREPQSQSQSNSCGRVALEGAATETVIERWVIQYENLRVLPVQSGDFSSSYKKTYKKSIILLRTIYSVMRLLPSYKLFRHLTSSSQISKYDVIYKVSSFSNPFSREDEQTMKQYSFVPVEAVNGRLCVCVTYRSVLSDFDLESSASFPPMIIADYVGSPTTDPMRAFPPPERGIRATSFPIRGTTRSPSSVPIHRPHSWSSGIHGAAPSFQDQPLGGSPLVHRGSYIPNDFISSPKNIQGPRIQNYRLPSSHYKTSSFDDQLSPPFSPASSPSPSPPAHLLSNSPNQSRLRHESAPLAIPQPILSRSLRYMSPNFSDPNRHSLPPVSSRNTKPEPSMQESPSPSGIGTSRKSEGLWPGELYSGMASQSFGSKVCRDGKEDSGRFSGLLSSGSSPRVGFSRSSSRSFQDDLDECDFSCPFDVDDVDTSDSLSSQNLDARKGLEFTSSALSMGRKSQDAAVGALVHMLRTAPPLRQGSSCYSTQSLKGEQEANLGTASGFFTPQKAADALEELNSYREMKDLLLSKSRTLSS